MSKKAVEPSREVTRAFELGYCAAMIRVRRDFPAAWRAGALEALSRGILGGGEMTEPVPAHRQYYSTHVRGLKLILMRCESAAMMLSWRRELLPPQKEQLQAAVAKLVAAASRLGVGKVALRK